MLLALVALVIMKGWLCPWSCIYLSVFLENRIKEEDSNSVWLLYMLITVLEQVDVLLLKTRCLHTLPHSQQLLL